jgi:hypothetical protein
MNGKIKILIVITLLVGMALACDLSRQANQPIDPAAIDTQVAGTAAALAGDDGSGGGDDTSGGQDTAGNQDGQPQVPTETEAPPPTDTPEPTATPTETPTPTIEPTLPMGIDDLNLGNPNVLYSFNNDNSVYTFSGNDNKAEVKDGTYQFTMVDEIDYTVWAFPFGLVLEDYYFETGITMPDDCVGKDRAGIIFGTPDKETDNGINYEISCDGNYRLWIWDGSESTFLIGWTKSDELFSGPGKTNKIGVMHRDKKITLYINGTLVDQLSDDTYTGPERVGYNIGVDEHYNVTFKFDDAAYWTNLP